MGKFWSVFFGLVLFGCFASLFVAFFVGWWLPKNAGSFDGADFLFYLILYLTGFFFVLTEVLLVWAMWKFGHRADSKSDYVHGNHRMEVLWTVVPAGILLYIAFAQIPAWAQMKSAEPTSWFVFGNFKKSAGKPDLVIQATGQQWQWRMRYAAEKGSASADPLEKYKLVPGDAADWNKEATEKQQIQREEAILDWANHEQFDDVHNPGEVHLWKGANVRVYLRTVDVIHSFFLPNMRVKQDTLPGRTIIVPMKPLIANCKFDEENGRTIPLDVSEAVRAKEMAAKRDPWDKSKDQWELTCAELCGSRHYAMRGRLYVHESKEDYLKWLHHAKEAATATRPEEPRTK